jgi:hypothetical protein
MPEFGSRRWSCDSGFALSQARVGRRLVVDEGWADRHVKVSKMTLEGLSETLRCRSHPESGRHARARRCLGTHLGNLDDGSVLSSSGPSEGEMKMGIFLLHRRFPLSNLHSNESHLIKQT